MVENMLCQMAQSGQIQNKVIKKKNWASDHIYFTVYIFYICRQCRHWVPVSAWHCTLCWKKKLMCTMWTFILDSIVMLFPWSVDWRTTAEKFVGESVWADGKENHSKGQSKGSLAFISHGKNGTYLLHALWKLFLPFKG